MNKPEISIIIPIYNEKGNIEPLLEGSTLIATGYLFEAIIIDDGSSDGSLEESIGFKKKFPWLKVLPLKMNFGQTAAMAAGIDASEGVFIVPLMETDKTIPPIYPGCWKKPRKDMMLSQAGENIAKINFLSVKFRPGWRTG